MTVKEFVKGCGLDEDHYVDGTRILKVLEKKGLAKVVPGGKREKSRGRTSILYDIADSAYEVLGGTAVVEVKVPDSAYEVPGGTAVVEAKVPEPQKVPEPEPQALVLETPRVPVAVSESQYVWGDEDE
jgi:hypothetical protein